ncbi:phage tail sheath protein [Tumebacillus algifaecis]|uniref:Phage tail sheath protein n=1 Tax=Tumebacillus algifaecis TaxID=1214604 RepID=A0A223D5Q6_9BACL|nr:phage tail sheath family protein [Tumebacillus algifaecis]ASS76817.1 phage tail sheath protein [Tumebacillus algifaecis]
MAGGTFTTQDKTRPGVYINFESVPKASGTLGDRGVVTMALPLSWGADHAVIAVNAGDDTSKLLGYDIATPQLLLVREALKRAKTILLYRLNAGTKAKVTVGGLTATAKYGGVRGNDLTVTIQQDIDDELVYIVRTMLQGVVLDEQTAAAIDGLQANDWLTFSGTGALTATASAPLTGGADGTATNQDHSDYLEAIELTDFQTIALVSTDNTLKTLYTAFVKRLRDSEGVKVQAVLENYATADYEGVISVKNGVVLSDGTSLTAAQATAWMAAATAGAAVNQSLTYSPYEDAVDANPRYTNSQIEAALRAGEIVFTRNNGRIVVEQDINTLSSYTPTKQRHFSKNRVLRVLDGINNDMKRTFESTFVGKVANTDDGRNLIRNEYNKYFDLLQNLSAIQNFDAQTDVLVKVGDDSESVYAEVNVQPVDAVEKIYMKVQVR